MTRRTFWILKIFEFIAVCSVFALADRPFPSWSWAALIPACVAINMVGYCEGRTVGRWQ